MRDDVRSGWGGGWWRMLALTAAVIAVDQVAKAIVTGHLAPGEAQDLPLGFRLHPTTNSGLAFGVFMGAGDVLIAVSVAVLIGLFAWFGLSGAGRRAWPAVGLIAGGLITNLIDRIRSDAVTDFIDPPSRQWTEFNLADVAILTGVLVLVASGVTTRDDGRGH